MESNVSSTPRITAATVIRYEPGQDLIEILRTDSDTDLLDWLREQLVAGNADVQPVIGWAPYTHRVRVRDTIAHADYLVALG